MTSRLSVIVPALEEESALVAALPGFLALGDELVVSDGGSHDGTASLARAAGAVVVSGPPGRGGQLARGAAQSTGEILLFLHVDTRLPEGSGTAIRDAIAGGAGSGAFELRFDPTTPLLSFGARLVSWRTRRFRVPLGDQAQFVRRDLYERLGGFKDWPILEDLDLALRLRKAARMEILAGPAVSSSRRFLAHGVARTVAVDWLIWTLFALGGKPTRLARLYRQVR